ncbi:hypothetical protein E2C01_027158 [Portunus trituberculatus]|uniref:Uncharacterized protein n=1 Tax=Portunus trituberculatus TaxID=210409 RepID=A0A5B7EK42_PORTR|nr:hypothetical protein [Portunus trituberculatus]
MHLRVLHSQDPETLQVSVSFVHHAHPPSNISKATVDRRGGIALLSSGLQVALANAMEVL